MYNILISLFDGQQALTAELQLPYASGVHLIWQLLRYIQRHTIATRELANTGYDG